MLPCLHFLFFVRVYDFWARLVDDPKDIVYMVVGHLICA